MYCPKCGNEVHADANFCSKCGKDLSVDHFFSDAPAQQPPQPQQPQAPNYNYPSEQPPYPQYPAYPPYNPQPQQPESNGIAVAGFICSFFVPLLGWIFGGIGLSRAKQRNGKGQGFSIAAIVIATVMFFINFSLLY